MTIFYRKKRKSLKQKNRILNAINRDMEDLLYAYKLDIVSEEEFITKKNELNEEFKKEILGM